jgi:hypothetical protein
MSEQSKCFPCEVAADAQNHDVEAVAPFLESLVRARVRRPDLLEQDCCVAHRSAVRNAIQTGVQHRVGIANCIACAVAKASLKRRMTAVDCAVNGIAIARMFGVEPTKASLCYSHRHHFAVILAVVDPRQRKTDVYQQGN